MALLYSKKTNSFYDISISLGNIPHDAVEITSEEHVTLLQGQSEGKLITADENGYPILVDPPPMSEQQMKEHEIAQDTQYLASTDYVVSKLAEAQVQGQDISPILEEYASVLTERENARIRIRINRDAISNS